MRVATEHESGVILVGDTTPINRQDLSLTDRDVDGKTSGYVWIIDGSLSIIKFSVELCFHSKAPSLLQNSLHNLFGLNSCGLLHRAIIAPTC